MAKAKKKAKVAPVNSNQQLDGLLDRVADLEKKQKLQKKAFKFAANECRPLYGMGALALIFDAIADEL